jgi:hypothetical protein
LLSVERLEDRCLFTASDDSGLRTVDPTFDSTPAFVAADESVLSSRHNRVNAFDVNRDGVVAPIDVLVVINVLRRYGSDIEVQSIDSADQGFFDVDNDSAISPIDVLRVINFLNFSSTRKPIAGAGGVTYAIGNSLTGDLVSSVPGQGLDRLTQSTSNPTTTGLHLNCSNSLDRISDFPDETCFVTPAFGKYRDALAKPVDNVFLQPHYGSLIRDELQAMKSLIDYTKQNPANSDTRFFLYAPWGAQVHPGSTTSYYDLWFSDLAKLDEYYFPSKKTFELMVNELKQSGYEVTLIPAAHTWISIIDAIRNGTDIELVNTVNGSESLGKLTEAQLWRDAIHASGVGGFSAAVAAYSAIYRAEPVGLDPRSHSAPSSNGYRLSATGARLVEQIAWQTNARLLYG